MFAFYIQDILDRISFRGIAAVRFFNGVLNKHSVMGSGWVAGGGGRWLGWVAGGGFGWRGRLFCSASRVVRIAWIVAVVGGGRNEGHTGFRRCAAPEKIRTDRTAGNNSLLCLLILQ